MTDRDLSLGFIRTDIGLAILGTLVSTAASALMVEWPVFALAAAPAGLLVFVALWHLGWRLAFPPRTMALDSTPTRSEGMLIMLAGFAAVFAVIGAAGLLVAR